MKNSPTIPELLKKIEILEAQNAMLRRDFGSVSKGSMVKVPEAFKPLFDKAQLQVSDYFKDLKMDPTQGTIEINEQRYVLVRASALSKDFLDTIQRLYADRGAAEAMTIGKNFLFDIAHVIGLNDAKAFQQKMNLTDPISKLSAGPIHFAYSGWAFVEILPDSNPSPDLDFYLHYHHPYSFEADSWVQSGKSSDTPVCIMNAGYSSGWCEESFGIPLTSVEVSCIAKGDAHCTFIMSPPEKIQEHLERFNQRQPSYFAGKSTFEIPTFFERKAVEEELLRARELAVASSKAKSDFVDNISHELRTPLGVILGFAGLMGKTSLSSQQQDYLESIRTSGNNLLSIINNILDLSKLDAGKVAIEEVSFDVAGVLEWIRVMFEEQAAAKHLILTNMTDKKISRNVIGDPTRLTQILMNLVGNAIKFTEEGSVRLTCEMLQELNGKVQLQFKVIDTGIGIPEAKRALIFERFVQADTDITRRYGGTGLGLAITKQLVEVQGGEILLETNTSKGSIFSFVLEYPIEQGYQDPANSHTITPDASTYQGKKILVVEDNYMVQRLTQELLQSNGMAVTIADNGLVAVEKVKDERFDLILMDLQMPVMDGYKATCMMRDELNIRTPIIAMTAHALNTEKDNCMHKGMDDYISKPFSEAFLLERISYWLSSTESIADNASQRLTDLSYFQKQGRTNTSFIREMIGIFSTQNPMEIKILETAIEAGDYEKIYKTAHTMRNTIGFFGLEAKIGKELTEIEGVAKSGQEIGRIAELASTIKPVLKRAIDELNDDETLQLLNAIN